jgi:hypothetical protein
MKIEHKILPGMIKVTIELPLAEFTSEDKIKVSTEQAQRIANEISEGRVSSVLKASKPIKNFLKNDDDKSRGTWIFELTPDHKEEAEKAPQRTTRTKKVTNCQKKTSKSTSIRGRMSKIAKETNEGT